MCCLLWMSCFCSVGVQSDLAGAQHSAVPRGKFNRIQEVLVHESHWFHPRLRGGRVSNIIIYALLSVVIHPHSWLAYYYSLHRRRMALKFWDAPSYDRTTKQTDRKRRIKLLRSYAPDWFVHLPRSVTVNSSFRRLSAGPSQFFWRANFRLCTRSSVWLTAVY